MSMVRELWRPRVLLLGAIRVYQSTLGPALPKSCRYLPTCSQYGYQAIERYGVFKGSWLTLKRLARCQPFGGHGYDPVP
ncbi:MAG TPA: membrane protein insertion efficiency factor YidD [Chloroflexota bacterium]|nr:membrane protein insertion efficiency factor YidD [Chloroflexota bacterium]